MDVQIDANSATDEHICPQEASAEAAALEVEDGQNEEDNDSNNDVFHQEINESTSPHASEQLGIEPSSSCSITWGSVKDAIYGVLLVSHVIITGNITIFGKVWLVVTLILYALRCFEIVKLGFRIVMVSWAIKFIIFQTYTYDEITYAWINLNQFWTMFPIICMGFFSCGFYACLTTVYIFIKIPYTLFQTATKFYVSIKYHKEVNKICNLNLSRSEDKQCAICLQTEGMKNTQPCTHQFHPSCLKTWLKDHRTCPVCRRQLY